MSEADLMRRFAWNDLTKYLYVARRGRLAKVGISARPDARAKEIGYQLQFLIRVTDSHPRFCHRERSVHRNLRLLGWRPVRGREWYRWRPDLPHLVADLDRAFVYEPHDG